MYMCLYFRYCACINCAILTCRDCIKSRDAQCVWDTSDNGGKCVYNNMTADVNGTGDVPPQ